MDKTIRNLDEKAYRALRVRAVMQGRNVGDLLNEAIRGYLGRASIGQGKSTLRDLRPVPFPEGNENLSQEIDAIVCGSRAAVIVLDSSFLIGFYNERDAHHIAAKTLMDQFLEGKWGKGSLLEYVFLEITTVLMLRRDPSTAGSAGRILIDAGELEFVPCADLFAETFESFSNQTGTQLSFTDAAIASVARSRAEGQILSFDGKFRKIAGLRVNGD